jgi:hypothetical protein
MTQKLNFGPQNNPSTPLAQAVTPAPQTSLLSTMSSALQGIHDAAMRRPELPPDGNFDLEIIEIRSDTYRSIGYAIFLDVKILQTDLSTCAPGGVYTAKIDGFANPDAKGFAFRDLKALCYAALAGVDLPFGAGGAPWRLTSEWDGSDQEWVVIAHHMVSSGCAVGRRVFAKTAQSAPGKKSGKTKLKVAWIPAQ